MNIKQARTRIQSLKREIVRDTKSAVARAVNAAEREAKRMSSGPLTLADLRKRDHPYAKRHGPLGKPSAMPKGTRSVINVQSGEFRADWMAGVPSVSGSTVKARLQNLNPVADFLQYGTEFMVRRPINVYMTDFLHNAALKELRVSTSRLERYYS